MATPPPDPLPSVVAPGTSTQPANTTPPAPSTQPDNTTEAEKDTNEKQPSGPRIIRWISVFGPLGPKWRANEERRPFATLAAGRCDNVLDRTGDLPEPTRSLYEGAASACLAAFHDQPKRWERAYEALAIVQPQTSRLNCLDRAVYQILESMTELHHQYPEARLTKESSEHSTEPACPQIVKLIPDHGPRQGGYPVRLVGNNLPPTAGIHFGDHYFTVPTERGREATITVPPADPQDRSVRVWVAGSPFGSDDSPLFKYDRVKPTRSPPATPEPR